jgi:phage baseplate assembly protein W
VKTLALVQGDLSPAPGGYLMYEGASKIHQDLALALKEAYGADQLHPRWGSILQRFIGTPLTDDVKTKVLTEINRVISNYITVQNARIVQDSNTGNLSNMTTDDVVRSISNISAQQIYDSLVVSVALETLSRQTVNINQVMS